MPQNSSYAKHFSDLNGTTKALEIKNERCLTSFPWYNLWQLIGIPCDGNTQTLLSSVIS